MTISSSDAESVAAFTGITYYPYGDSKNTDDVDNLHRQRDSFTDKTDRPHPEKR